MLPILTRSVIVTTLAAFLLAALPAASYAGMIGTAEALHATGTGSRAADLARVEAGLARADVRAGLERLGVDPAAAAGRAQALSDADLARLAGRMDALPAGGDGGLFVVLGVVFLVLVILDYVGAIDLFKTHHRR